MSFRTIEPGRPIRLAFLGCGGVTRKHSQTLRRFAGVKRYYASRSAEKAAAYCREWKGSGAFDSYAAAIKSAETDVVLIATPPDSHLDLALHAIRAGKHVIIEKPPLFHASDFDLLETARQKTGVQVMVAENYFYKPLLRTLREILQSGVIGDVRFLFINATKTQKTSGWRDEAGQAGGGAFYEGGIHWVDFLANLGWDVQSVRGFLPYAAHTAGASYLERSFQLVVTYAHGPVATLLYSWEIHTLFKGLRISRIYGTQGSVTLESNGVFIFVRGKKWRLRVLPGLKDMGGSKAMFADFFNALRTGAEPAYHLGLARRDLELVEAAYRSAHLH
ncbi:MAG: Gfo/Idh/MocA family oxidoreductase [Saprospirales bacterium]|nr:Gfo/Idh/MocA family oxidoreductase [Saprospirales bacterium]